MFQIKEYNDGDTETNPDYQIFKTTINANPTSSSLFNTDQQIKCKYKIDSITAYNVSADLEISVSPLNVDETEILQKRVISLVEGVFLPLISLGFIKSLIDYLRPEVEKIEQHKEEESKEEEEVPNIDDDHADLTRPVSRWPNSFKNK